MRDGEGEIHERLSLHRHEGTLQTHNLHTERDKHKEWKVRNDRGQARVTFLTLLVRDKRFVVLDSALVLTNRDRAT